ncbi:MAG: hypothetical protein P8O03_06615 [Ilumatobacter sp.]|nr:hypothetical protein [Ilumatobacter sp.]MDG2040698.1 hypothetical protein [Ilumatobacter sp.]NKB41152.1 hypothetical protein [Ilumatobacter sp.]
MRSLAPSKHSLWLAGVALGNVDFAEQVTDGSEIIVSPEQRWLGTVGGRFKNMVASAA